GGKTVIMDEHEQYVTLTGWVRPEDVTPQNVVESWRIADSRIEYRAEGKRGKPRRGLLSRILGVILPRGHDVSRARWPPHWRCCCTGPSCVRGTCASATSRSPTAMSPSGWWATDSWSAWTARGTARSARTARVTPCSPW